MIHYGKYKMKQYQIKSMMNYFRWAFVGQTEMMITEKIDQDKYMTSAFSLQDHVTRLNHKAQSKQVSNLAFEKE